MRKMFSKMQCRLCILGRLVNQRTVSTISLNTCTSSSVSNSCEMEKDNLLDKHKCYNQRQTVEGRKSNIENLDLCGSEEKGMQKKCSQKNVNVLDDPAVIQVGCIMKPCTNEVQEEIFQYKKDRYNRRSIPFSSGLLENSFHETVTQKRKVHLSGESNYKVARTKTEETLELAEEIKCPNKVKQIDIEYGVNRQWELTRLGIEQLQRPRPGFEFTIMSYNILAQNLLEDNKYLYRESPQQVLDWKYRSEKLLQEIQALNAEILCLQEVNKQHYTVFLEPKLKQLGYNGVYVKRTGDKLDGCATFYKREKFTLEQSVSVPYYKSNYSLLDRDNVGLVVKLRPHKHPYSEEDSICVANTHLLFNPRRGDVKLGQAMCLLAEIDKVAKTNRNHRCQVLICGDFNATPFSDLYKFMVQGFLRYEGLLTRTISGQREGQYGKDNYLSRDFFPSDVNISDQCQHIESENKHAARRSHHQENYGHRSNPAVSQSSGCIWHKLNLVSTYRHTIERLGHYEREVTTQHSADACTVDYIFYSVQHRNVHTRRNKHTTSNVLEDKLRLLGRWGLMSSREIQELGNLPNQYNPSDHLPLLVKMMLI
ncbi:protein angel homolog 2-like isoform X1 [Mytilus edulis]|uniref:protein angel homolog 2-like isoform X1 n=1 Tax=Mytilus edulis TaxID=6550 RepID=UPI0039F0A258